MILYKVGIRSSSLLNYTDFKILSKKKKNGELIKWTHHFPCKN